MVFLIPFTIFAGTIVSLVFLFVYKKHIKKHGTVMEKSFTANAPKIFGTVNVFLSLAIGIWYIANPSAFAQEGGIDNRIAFVVLSIFYTYFHVLALPISIGCTALSVLIKKYISKLWFLYCILTNIIASILLFVLTYLILNK
jgi:hypothetical protein